MNTRLIPLIFLVAASLAGCSTPPVLLHASPEGVVVRYDPMVTSTAEATAAARKACARYHRKAVQRGSAGTVDTFISFACVKP